MHYKIGKPTHVRRCYPCYCAAAPYDVSSRTATAAAYIWQPQASVAVGEPLVTPNIAKVVEEIVGGSGWTSGSSMGILFEWFEWFECS